MESITFNCEVITPLFISGADGKTPELRPPSIRGEMRWWFRAMMGGILLVDYYGQDLVNKLSSLESSIFGSNKASSKFGIRIRTQLKDQDIINFNFRDFKIRYMGYGLQERKYIIPKTTIEFEFTFFNNDPIYQKMVLSTFWLFLYLGSLGSRARRGWGCLEIVDEKDVLDLEFKTIDISQLPQFLKMNLSKLKEWFSNYSNVKNTQKTTINLPLFSTIHSNFWKLLIIQDPQIGYENALRYAGNKLRTFREDKSKGVHTGISSSGRPFNYCVTKDYDNVKGFFNNPKSIATSKCSIFGLPHQYQFQSIGEKVTISGEKEERRASPLYMKFFKQQNNNNYYLALQVFKSKFIEGKLKFENTNDETDRDFVSPPDYQEIDKFYAQFKNVWEVKL